jgi:hypothetical protein
VGHIKIPKGWGRENFAMKRFGFFAAAVLGGACLLATASAASADTVLDGDGFGGNSYLGVYGHTASWQDPRQTQVNPTSLSYANIQTVSGSGWASTASYDLTQSHFDINFTQSRDGQKDVTAHTYGYLYFHVTENTTYDLAGQISVDNLGSAGGLAYITAELYDLTTKQYVNEYNQDYDMLDGTLVLGSNDGEAHSITGSLSASGSLQAGHAYRFFHKAYIYAPDADGGATATGLVSLGIGGPASAGTPVATPLPCAATAGLALIGGHCLRRGRRKVAAE